MTRVFIPILPTRYDKATDKRVPSLDLNAAAKYGELVNMLIGPVGKEELPEALDNIREQSQYIEKNDLVLVVGDVVLVAAAIAYVSQRNGSVNVLRWDRQRRDYDVVKVKGL